VPAHRPRPAPASPRGSARRRHHAAGSHGEKPDRYLLGITRSYQTRFIPEYGFTVYLPAPFKTVHEYEYGTDGRLNTTARSR
jgi:hypothetical protein